MATVATGTSGPITLLGGLVFDAIAALGDLSLFAGRTFGWLARRRPSSGTLIGSFYSVGVRSVPVVAVTGMFIGMVLAVQSYSQFANLGLATRLGSIINVALVSEMGLVLDSTMLADRDW